MYVCMYVCSVCMRCMYVCKSVAAVDMTPSQVVHVCMYVCMYVCMWCMYVCMYAYVCGVCMYVRVLQKQI